MTKSLGFFLAIVCLAAAGMALPHTVPAAGSDTPCSLDQPPDVAGTEGPDTIRRSQVDDGDRVFTYGGDDKIAVAAESVTVCAGNGRDNVVADTGAVSPRFFGEGGGDVVHAVDRRRAKYATFDGGNGPDRVGGTNSPDLLRGGRGDDYLHGRAGKDAVYCGGGFDHLIGDEEGDLLIGGGYIDYLYGLGGPDRMHGGRGSDWLIGSEGEDHANGDGNTDYCKAEYKNSCERTFD